MQLALNRKSKVWTNSGGGVIEIRLDKLNDLESGHTLSNEMQVIRHFKYLSSGNGKMKVEKFSTWLLRAKRREIAETETFI